MFLRCLFAVVFTKYYNFSFVMDTAGVTLPYQSICVTCLSQDRKLFPVHDSKSHVSFLLDLSDGALLCWECHFFVRKVAAFRGRAAKAQAVLASALRQTNETKINSLSTLVITPVHKEISVESLRVSVKIEDVDEEHERKKYEHSVEDFYGSHEETLHETFKELDDESLLPVSNKKIRGKCDEAAAVGDTTDDVTSSKLLSENDSMDMRQEHPCKLEPAFDEEGAPDYSCFPARDELTQGRSVRHQYKFKTCFVGVKQFPLSSYSVPVTFDCDLKLQAPGDSNHKLGEQSDFCKPVQIYTCDTCGKHFKSQSRFNKHAVTHSRTPYNCDKCDKRFQNKMVWLKHYYKKHTDGEMFVCDICHKRFKRKRYMIKHIAVHGEKAFCCDVCGKQFTYKANFAHHLRTHTDERPYGCDKCGKRFRQSAGLKSHLEIHVHEKPFTCDKCNKMFATKTSLSKHYASHSNLRPFFCDVCQKRFKDKSTLSKHLNLHTGLETYRCDVCFKIFATKPSAVRHMRLVHTHTDVRPFCCDICQARFKIKSQLGAHMAVHTGERAHGCHVCGKRFKKGSVLKAHLRIHTGEKPFSCEVCGKRFNQKSPMKTHLRTHMGKKAKKET